MTVHESLREAVGDTARFGAARDRVEQMLQDQLPAGRLGPSDWVVVPLQRAPSGYYLLAASREGERRGREILTAFLGPEFAQPRTIVLAPETEAADRLLVANGLRECTFLGERASAPPALVRMEDAVATLRLQDARVETARPSHVDLLRDLRLSLMSRDAAQVDMLLDRLRDSGRLSPENLRFLRIQALGRLERWRELRDVPHLRVLLQARRPREVNETLLQMLWWTDVAPLVTAGNGAAAAFEGARLLEDFGALLHVIDVPAEPASRFVALVVARATGEVEREQRLVAAAEDDAERATQQRILNAGQPIAAPVELSGLQLLWGQGRYEAVVAEFCAGPQPADADLALQAALEVQSPRSEDVLRHVCAMLAAKTLVDNRRTRRDIDELAQFVEDSCTGWLEWSRRIAGTTFWSRADTVARDLHVSWAPADSMPRAEVEELFKNATTAWSGTNQGQIAATLDLLCLQAAAAMRVGATSVSDDILLLLLDQGTMTGPVREAFLQLFEEALSLAPDARTYEDLLGHAGVVWDKVASVIAADWALSTLDILFTAPCTVPPRRDSLATEFIRRMQPVSPRLSVRQRSEFNQYAKAVGADALPGVEDPEGEQVWRRLHERVVGVYSLLPRVETELGTRLKALCATATVQGNADKVATDALKNLARRADHLIVDTWHASHAATAAIDAERPKHRQILPKGRGVSAFLRALEEALA